MATKHKLGNWYLSEKGYPRFCSGPHRGQLVHRVVMALHLGRSLERDEDVHHRDQDKKNFRVKNLQVLGHSDHGWVSAKQHWYMKQQDQKLESEWKEHFKQERVQCPSRVTTATSQTTGA